MAFDFQRALSLGRQALRLIDALGLRPGPTAPPRGADDRRRPVPSRRGDGRGAGPATTSHVSLPDHTGRVTVEYAPAPGPAAGPGEVVWTWVPFEEMDGRGKDRPVLLIGRDGAHLLGLMLTSRDHTGGTRRDDDYVDVGSGPWDRAGRASEAKLDRILRVDPAAVRREGAVLDRARFDAVADALATAQGWTR